MTLTQSLLGKIFINCPGFVYFEILGEYKPKNTIDINFEYGENFNSRYLTISAYKKLKIFDEFKSL